VGRVAKVLVGMTCTLGRVDRSDKIVLGILDAIVCMCTIAIEGRVTHHSRVG